MSTGKGVAPAMLSEPFALSVSPWQDTVPSWTSGIRIERYSRIWRTGFSNE